MTVNTKTRKEKKIIYHNIPFRQTVIDFKKFYFVLSASNILIILENSSSSELI